MINKVLVIGAGTMGTQIALQCAIHRYQVTLYDTSASNLKKSLDKISSLLQGEPFDLCRPHLRMKSGIEPSIEILNRISIDDNALQAAQNADILIESAPEIIAIKNEIFSLFNTVCPSYTIFTSNSSSINPNHIATATNRPSQFAALHFHPAVTLCNLVDIVPCIATSMNTISLLKKFAASIGQTYHEYSKEAPHYVFNTLIAGWLSNALELYAEGVANPEEIDRDWMIVSQMKYGPFGYFDLVGLDVIRDVTLASSKHTEEEKQHRASIFNRYIKRGWLGAKSGRGFYLYPNPKYLEPNFLKN